MLYDYIRQGNKVKLKEQGTIGCRDGDESGGEGYAGDCGLEFDGGSGCMRSHIPFHSLGTGRAYPRNWGFRQERMRVTETDKTYCTFLWFSRALLLEKARGQSVQVNGLFRVREATVLNVM